MILRPARAGDAPDLAEISNALIRDTLITFTTLTRSADDVAADIVSRGAAFQVAEVDGRAVGFATYGAFRGGPGYALTGEHTVHLAERARGLGIGRALITRLEQVARAQGLHVLVGGISSANPAGLAFHERLGFAIVGRMPEVGHKQGRWLDLILVQKILGRDPAPDSAALAR